MYDLRIKDIRISLYPREWEKPMDSELNTLLARARQHKLSPDELEEHRLTIATANGTLTDARITIDTMKATRTIMLAAEQPKTKP